MQGTLAVVSKSLSIRQRIYVCYLTFVLIDLLVLKLFQEYCAYVTIDSFTICLLAAILLQFMLKITIFLKHLAADFFKSKSGLSANYELFRHELSCLFPGWSYWERSTTCSGIKYRSVGPITAWLRLLLPSPPGLQLNRWV